MSVYCKIIAFMCTRPAARHGSVIISIEFTIEICIHGHHQRVLYTGGGRRVCLSVNARKAIQTTCMRLLLKTDATKTVQIKCKNDLCSFQLHFINFVLTEPKLAHSPVKFPVRFISHVVMNIIMDKTGSTAIVNSAKVNSAKLHIYSNPQNVFPSKFLAIRYLMLLMPNE